MATQSTIKWVKNVYGGGALVQEYPEGDSETYAKGTPVVYDESEDGIVELANSSGVPSNQTMLGIALEDASGVSDQLQDVLIPRPGDVFSASIASSQTTTVAPALDQIGDLAGIILLNSTGGDGDEYVVDTGNTNWVKIIGLEPQDLERRGGLVASLAAGDRVLFQFLGSILDSDASQT